MTEKDAQRDVVDPDLIRSLAELLTETGLSEIEIERGGTRVRVARQGMQVLSSAMPASAPMAAPAAQPGSMARDTAHASEATHPGTVRSPMVGTAYRSAEPGSRPFVEVGDTVN